MTDVHQLPFDQFQRYRLVADVLRDVAGGEDSLHVLDVGGGTGLLRHFLPRARVTLVDVVPGGARGDVALGDGSRLPFGADSVDAVCAFDTLEHVPPDRREPFVDDCLRVARSWVCLAGPYHTDAVRAAEEQLYQFLEEELACEHRFLGEHLDYGCPDRASVEARMRTAGAEVLSIGHGNLELWQTLMRLEMTFDEPALLPLGRTLFELYARALYSGDRAEPVYRHAVVAALDGARLPDVERLFDPAPGSRPVDGLPAAAVRLLEESLQMVAGDVDRRAWMAERATFQESVAVLQRDLDGHRSVLADRELQLAEHKRVQAELEARVRELYAKTPIGMLKGWKRRLLGR